MHEKHGKPHKTLAPMIRDYSSKQLTLAAFDWPLGTTVDKDNRWVKLAQCIPWDALAHIYYQGFSTNRGSPAKSARLVIGALIIKHKFGYSDEETVLQIQENPYLQYFVGLPGFTTNKPFVPSLFVEIRKRLGASEFEGFHQAIIAAHDKELAKQEAEASDLTPDQTDLQSTLEDREAQPTESASSVEDDTPTHQGQLILDATVVEQVIRFPTDLSLVNEARELSEHIIDGLYPHTPLTKKPRTYRNTARKAYLAIVKQKRPGTKKLRRGLKQQLQYLRRNLRHIDNLLRFWPEGTALPLPRWLLYRYWVIQHLYQQQWQMYQTKARRCDDRIVSISQPYVRPIVRGKQHKAVEFGAKLSVSLDGQGFAQVDELRWEAFHEGHDLPSQVEAYRQRTGYYPEKVIADPIYGNRENRRYLKQKGIYFAGKPLGRPKKETEANRDELKQEKAQRKADYLQRIPIEGKFGQGKQYYQLNKIKAKRKNTSIAWIHSIFLVMNLMILARIFFVCRKYHLTNSMELLKQAGKLIMYRTAHHFIERMVCHPTCIGRLSE